MRQRSSLTAIACATLLVLPLAAADAGAATKRGKVVRVVDGDSVRVKVGKRTRAYGLLGVSAPARSDCFGREARSRLRKLLPKRTRVRIVTERGAGRRLAYVYRGRKLVNAALLKSGHAETGDTDDLRLGGRLERAAERAQERERGLWGVCEDSETGPAPADPAPAPAPPTETPAPDQKQQDIAEMDRLLQGVRVYRIKTENGTTDEETAHLCPDHRFLYVLQTSFNGSPIAPNQATGTWKVVDAFIDRTTGVRQAIVETLADGEAQPARTFLQANADGVSGRWDDQPAQFSSSDRC